MNKLTSTIALAAALALAVPTAALAGLPNPSNPTIDVPKSLGGVTLGMKVSKADKAWGNNGDCESDKKFDSASCFYISKKPELGSASIDGPIKEKVSLVAISAGINNGNKYVFKGDLLAFETPEGIGLGDKGSKIKRAYPKAEKLGTQGYTVNGKGDSFMNFITADGKHITTITMGDGQQG